MKIHPSAIAFAPINRNQQTKVKLGGKHIGTIRPVAGGFQYFPKGRDVGGDIFPTLGTCKQSLLSD